MIRLRGRALSDRDIQGAPPVLVINERLAQRYFEDADPVGQRILIQEINRVQFPFSRSEVPS